MQSITIITLLTNYYFLTANSQIIDQRPWNAPDRIVSTRLGSVRGFQYISTAGYQYTSADGIQYINDTFAAAIYLGIPYAQPPINQLRLRKPLPVSVGWTNVLDASQWAAGCVPNSKYNSYGAEIDPNSISEDCLYLNIFVPDTPSTYSSGYAVMFWIHGGDFNSGSASEYGYVSITDNLVSKGVLVVTVQYRLGPLGFFSTGDASLPGNLGLWDLRMALGFVQSNIAAFGGDPSRVTIFGQDAGAASCSALALSPYSYDLFSQSIEISGVLKISWAEDDDVVTDSLNLATAVNCVSQSNSQQLLDCMRQVSIEQLFAVQETMGYSRSGLNSIKFAPRFDGDFFPFALTQLYVNAPPKSKIIGVTDMEGGIYADPTYVSYTSQLTIPVDDYNNYSADALRSFITSYVGNSAIFGNQTKTANDLLWFEYVDRFEGVDLNSTFYLQQYINLVGDILFYVPIYQSLQVQVAIARPIWFYQFEYYDESAFPYTEPIEEGVYHSMDLPYILGNYSGSIYLNSTDNDTTITDFVTSLFTSFAKYGDPTPTPLFNVTWSRASVNNPDQYLGISMTPQMQMYLRKTTMQFWNTLLPDIFGTSQLAFNLIPTAAVYQQYHVDDQ